MKRIPIRDYLWMRFGEGMSDAEIADVWEQIGVRRGEGKEKERPARE